MESQREVVANAVARWAGDCSASPFNERHSEFPEYVDLIFAVAEEARHWVNDAPPEYLDVAISLVQRPPDSNWNGWASFNGSEDWNFYLEDFLGL